MSILKSVAISGTVGKQVYDSTRPAVLRGIFLDAGPTSAGSFVIRDGNASGEIKLSGRKAANDSDSFPMEGVVRFDKGMHVKVLGQNAVAYLELD